MLVEAREDWGLEEGQPGKSCSHGRRKPRPEMLHQCREGARKKYSHFSLLPTYDLLLGFPLAEAKGQCNADMWYTRAHVLDHRAGREGNKRMEHSSTKWRLKNTVLDKCVLLLLVR